MKKTMISALSGLAMLVSACSGTQVRSAETETHEGFEITYDPSGFAIEGEDSHDHRTFYYWRSLDNSGHLVFIRSNASSIFDDDDGNGVIDVYSNSEVVIDLADQQYANSRVHRQLQSIYDEHRRELPVRHAGEQWDARWRSSNTR